MLRYREMCQGLLLCVMQLSAQDHNFYSPQDRHPLHFAVLEQDVKKVFELLKENSQCINQHDAAQASPLDYALATRNKKIVKLLLRHKANPNLLNKKGWTPTLTAAACCDHHDDVSIFKLLKKAGADFTWRAFARGYTPDEWLDLMVPELVNASSVGTKYKEVVQAYRGSHDAADRARFDEQRLHIQDEYKEYISECRYFLCQLLLSCGVTFDSRKLHSSRAWLDTLKQQDPFEVRYTYDNQKNLIVCEPLRDFFLEARRRNSCGHERQELASWVNQTSDAVKNLYLRDSKAFFLSLFSEVGFSLSHASTSYLTLLQWVEMIEEKTGSLMTEELGYLLRVKSKEIMTRIDDGYAALDLLSVSRYGNPSSGVRPDTEDKRKLFTKPQDGRDDFHEPSLKKQSEKEDFIKFVELLRLRGHAIFLGSNEHKPPSLPYMKPFSKIQAPAYSMTDVEAFVYNCFKKQSKIDAGRFEVSLKALDSICRLSSMKNLCESYVNFQMRQYNYGRVYNRGMSDPDLRFDKIRSDQSVAGSGDGQRELNAQVVIFKSEGKRPGLLRNRTQEIPSKPADCSELPMRLSKKHKKPRAMDLIIPRLLPLPLTHVRKFLSSESDESSKSDETDSDSFLSTSSVISRKNHNRPSLETLCGGLPDNKKNEELVFDEESIVPEDYDAIFGIEIEKKDSHAMSPNSSSEVKIMMRPQGSGHGAKEYRRSLSWSGKLNKNVINNKDPE